MEATIWGCRGSIASPGPDTVRYGGNTSCVSLRTDDDVLIVLDAGTGLRALGAHLQREPARTIHVLLTHLHMDHLEGLGFFPELTKPDVEIHIWGPPSPIASLAQRVGKYLEPPLFPIELSALAANATFNDAPHRWDIGGVGVHAHLVTHQGPTLGYRLERDGRALAYLPDHEPGVAGALRTTQLEWISGHALAAGADVLMHDAQYTEEEYQARVGWGHSSVAHVVDFAVVCGVRQLVLFHHDPRHSDGELETHLGRARELWDGEGAPPLLAREGMTLDV